MELQQKEQFTYISELISKAKSNAFLAVNKELVNLYWGIGAYVSNQVHINNWGKSVVKELSLFIKKNKPNIKGFSAQNIWRMKQFYETYKEDAKLSPLVREVTWTNNMIIFSACKSMQENEFYLKMSIKEKWSKRELQRQIDSAIYERVMMSNQKLSSVARVLPQDIQNVFKDTYVLEMLDLPEPHSENTLKKQISNNISKFLLEFGRDFAFMGEEYPLQVGNQDFAIDLLFYHRTLQCLIAVELKIGKFKPEHLGQLNFYLEALDRDIKTKNENPSIGILLCKSKDETVVEYAMSRNISPALVADYKTKLPEKRLLQQKWNDVLNQLDEQNDDE